ncbi:MAG: diguanylate cyclase [Gammaproteobacteria bacterium]|nr:diguanylate cyclase [Gammaproteobacteria bacterium]
MGRPAVLGALLDRTAWVRAESDLRIRNRALAAIGEGVVIAEAGDKNLPVIYGDDAFSEITGYSPEEIYGRNCRFLQNGDRDQPALKSIRTALRTGEECQAVLRNYRKDGSMFWNELTLSPVKDENGILTHFVGIQRDITARRKIEQQLNLQSAALEAAANPVFIIEMQGRTIQWVNQAFSKLYGYTLDEARGSKPTILDSGHHTEDHWQTLLDTIDSGRPWSNTTVNRTRNGYDITVTEMVTSIMDESGETSHLVVVHEDITAQIEANRKLHWMATHDSLTGLTNRAAFREVLEHEIARVQRNGNQLAVHFIDLDHFKEINDSLGHQTGDEVLKIVAGLLNDIVRKSDMVSRFGGDEFAILQIDTNDTSNIALFAERLLRALNQPLGVGGAVARCGASLGIAIYDGENPKGKKQEEAEAILEKADMALYEAKKKHRGNYIIYTESTRSARTQTHPPGRCHGKRPGRRAVLSALPAPD